MRCHAGVGHLLGDVPPAAAAFHRERHRPDRGRVEPGQPIGQVLPVGRWLSRLGLMRVSTNSRLGRRMRARGEFIIGTTRRRLQRAGVRFRPRLIDAHGHTARFADGSTLDVTTVIWATGFRPDYSWLHIPGAADGGRIAHRRGVTEVPGLYVLGLSWQHTRGSALLGFVHDDAAYLANRITAHGQATTRPLESPGQRKPRSAPAGVRASTPQD